MSQFTLFHNPRCSKSRAVLALLGEHDIEPAIRRYLEDPPTIEELRALLKKLGISASELLRKGEDVARELGLADSSVDEERLLEAMAEHPILIERPILVNDGRAVIGRPPEQVLCLLEGAND